MQLLFWVAVEDLKASVGNRRVCNSKMRRIHQRFCGADRNEIVAVNPQSVHPAICELGKKEKLSPFELLATQATVVETMERRWYQSYLSFLAAEESIEKEDSEELAKKPVCKEHTVRFSNNNHINHCIVPTSSAATHTP